MSALRFRGDIVLIENEDVSVIITLIIILTLSFWLPFPCCIFSVNFDEAGHSESLRLSSYYMFLLSQFLLIKYRIFSSMRDQCDFVEESGFVLMSCAGG